MTTDEGSNTADAADSGRESEQGTAASVPLPPVEPPAPPAAVAPPITGAEAADGGAASAGGSVPAGTSATASGEGEGPAGTRVYPAQSDTAVVGGLPTTAADHGVVPPPAIPPGTTPPTTSVAPQGHAAPTAVTPTPQAAPSPQVMPTTVVPVTPVVPAPPAPVGAGQASWSPQAAAPAGFSPPPGWQAPPVGPPGTSAAGPRPYPVSSNAATVALVLSLSGFVAWALCPAVAPLICAIIALVFASKGSKEIKQSNGWITGSGLVLAARIISWINIGLVILSVVLFIIFIALIGASGGFEPNSWTPTTFPTPTFSTF